MARDLATPKKGGGRALAVLSEELAQIASAESAAVPQAAGQFISTKGKRFTFQDEVLPTPLSVIIVDHALTNAFYPNGYEEGNPQPPACWAVGKTEADMIPPADLAGRVSDACTGCPNNEFGSAERGKGKACKNGRILAVLGVDGHKKLTEKVIAEAGLAYLRLSPTGLRPFNGYLKRVTGSLSRPLFTVITQLDFDANTDYPIVLPTFGAELQDEGVIRAIMARRQDIQDELLAGFPRAKESDDEDPRPARGKKKPDVSKRKPGASLRRNNKF